MKRPLSMTAFGRGECVTDGGVWTVEVRSVNHRYADINIKMPRKIYGLEEMIKKEISAFYSRGHIDTVVEFSGSFSGMVRPQADLDLAGKYLQCLNALKKNLSLNGEPDLDMLLNCKDVITTVEEGEDLDNIWPLIRKALISALNKGLIMREDEGESIKKDLLNRLGLFSETLKSIETKVPELIQKKETLLKERLDNLLKGVDIEPIRFAQEVALMADKSDITEELVRLHSHARQFAHFLEKDEPVGRRLDFLLQEFLREVNTMASKINDAAVAHQTVDLKNELEKMREQVQNLE